MIVKIVCGIIALTLVLAFVLPTAIKIKSIALSVVISIGVVMMLIDLWQSLREND
jgi:hypothetical protein